MRPATVGWALGGAIVAVMLASLAWGLAHPAGKAVSSPVGKQAPDLTVRTLEGGSVRVADLRGRPLVLNFWSSGCPPCRQEDPALKAAAQASGDRVAFLGVDIQDTDAAARAYATELGLPYPVGPASAGSYLDYGVTGPPETFFIDSRGKVVAKFVGALDRSTLDVYLKMLA